MKFGWHCHCEAEYQHIEAEFGQDFEPGVWLSFWWWVSIKILRLEFSRDFDADFLSRFCCVLSFWSWCLVEIWELNLVKILKMIFDQPMEWLKSYFGESTLLFVPLCFWQCFSLIFLFYILWCIAELALVTVPVGVSRAQPLSSIKPRLTHPDTHLCNDSPPKTLSKQKKYYQRWRKHHHINCRNWYTAYTASTAYKVAYMPTSIADSAQTGYCPTFPCPLVSHRRDISSFLDNLIV